jgi:hydrogenase nickel incorporation protein HypA/HybF
MHEWALAEAIIMAASEIADKEHLKQITGVRVTVGELQQVERDILQFALLQLKTARFHGTRFEIDTERARLKCRVCGYTWTFQKENLDKDVLEAIHFVPEVAHTYIKCPECRSPDFDVKQGRGVWLQTVRGVR